MKHIKTFAIILALGGLMVSCKDDDVKNPGNPVMEVTGDLGTACFGDYIRFDVKASDSQVPLSTIHAELYFDSELVNSQVIRTKVSGEVYPVEVYVPYIANIPDGSATLRLTLQNINFTITEKIYSVKISHADYPYLTFVTDDGMEYTMQRVSMYNYEVTDNFPGRVPGKIIAPAEGGATDEVTFGYEGSSIKVNGMNSIPFTNGAAGVYTVAFNTFTMEGSPFTSYMINDNVMEEIAENIYQVDLNNLAKGSKIVFSGIPEFDEFTINPDFFQANGDGTFSFMAYDGNYRVIADTKKKYFQVVKLAGGEPATLSSDGKGALWIIGEGIGYPNLKNAPNWEADRAICMAPVSETVYRVTVVGGENIDVNSINFKFFGQPAWADAVPNGIEITGDMLTSQSDLIGVGKGKEVNGADNGNLFLQQGVTLEVNTIYIITVDLTNGVNNGVLTTEVAGENQFDEIPAYLNGEKMLTSNNTLYSLLTNLNPGSKLTFTGNVDVSKIYVDPDYFAVNGAELEFLPISGYYNVVADVAQGYITAKAVDDAGTELSLQPDGSGALWLMGDCGNPSIANAFGWTPGAAYCMAQVSPGVYQFTGHAGPALSETPGDRFQYNSIQMKFFFQDGWGAEFSGNDNLTMVGTAGDYLRLQDDGNFFLQNGVTLEEGATYRVIVDLSNGVENGTFDFVKL